MQENLLNRILVLAVIFYVIAGVYFIFYGGITLEEGAYLYAGKLVYGGKVLYRDFQYGQTPLFPYVYGIPQKIFGNSLYVGRITSLILGILTLLMAIKIAQRLGGKMAGVVTAALIVFNPITIQYFTKSLTYVLTAFFIILSWFILTCGLRRSLKIVLSVFAMCAAVATRIIAAPALLFLLSYIFLAYRRHWTSFILAIGSAMASMLLFFGPFYVLDKDSLIFHLFGSQLERGYVMMYYRVLPAFYWFYNRLSFVFESIANNLAVFVSLTTIAAYLVYKTKGRGLKTILNFFKKHDLVTLFASSAASVTLMNFVPNPAYLHYHTIAIPLTAVVIGWGVSCIYDDLKEVRSRQAFLLFLAVTVVLTPLVQGKSGVHKKPVIESIRQTADFIKKHTGKQDEILSFSCVEAVEAHRQLPAGLERGIYTYHPRDNVQKCRRYNLLDTESLISYIRSRKAKAVLLTNRYFYSYHLDPVPEERRIIENNIKENYLLAKVVPDFAGWGKAYVYLPKEKNE